MGVGEIAAHSPKASQPTFGAFNRCGYRVLRLLAAVLIRPYFRLTLEGAQHLPAHGAFLIAPNHGSYLDPVVLQAAIPQRRLIFLMTRAWYERPLLRAFFRAMRCIPIEGHGRNRDAIERCVATLALGLPVCIFPEGGVTRDGTLGRFHSGVAALSLRTRAPIVPAAILGTREALPRGRAVPSPHRITVRLGAPIRPGEHEDAGAEDRRARLDATTARVRNAVAALIAAP